MIKYISAIIFLLVLSTPASAGFTVWGIKGEIWEKIDQDTKYFYLQGLLDGLVFNDLTVHETKISTEISVDQYVKTIDDLYGDYKNSLIPVAFLLRIVSMELDGTDKTLVELELQSYRKKFSGK